MNYCNMYDHYHSLHYEWSAEFEIHKAFLEFEISLRELIKKEQLNRKLIDHTCEY